MAIQKTPFLFFLYLACPDAVARAELARIQLTDAAGLEPAALDAARRESEALFATAGVQVIWNESGDDALARIYILERIPAKLRRALQFFGTGVPLAVFFDEREFQRTPVIYVSRSAVNAQAGGAPGARVAPPLLGRALGRVMAHELAHALVEPRHARRGILKASFGQEDLVRADPPGLGFTPGQMQRLALLARSSIPPVPRRADRMTREDR